MTPNTPQPNESVERVMKEFENHPRISVILEIIGCQKHGADFDRYTELWDSLYNDDEHEIQDFLRTHLLTSYAEGRASMKRDIEAVVSNTGAVAHEEGVATFVHPVDEYRFALLDNIKGIE